ncbi:MAG: DUF4097 family beta strand repeat-containing protein [Vicinamibacterales bacterium]
MRSPFPRPGRAALVVVAALTLSPSAAFAQDVRVKIVVPDEAVVATREAIRAVIDAIDIPGLARELEQAAAEVRDAAAHVHGLGREARAAVRDTTRVVTRGLSRDVLRSVTSALDGLAARDGWVWQRRDWRATQTARETRALPIGDGDRLELRNVSGTIRVEGTSGREATIDVTRRAQGRTDADARQALERTEVQISRRDGVVTVEAPMRRSDAAGVSVDYVVRVPARTGVTINSVAGAVDVRGVRGGLTIETAAGSVSVTDAANVTSVKTLTGTLQLRDVTSDGRLEVGTLAGALTLERVKARQLVADTVQGSFRATGIEAGGAKVTTVAGEIHFAGPLARGGRYEFHSHNGAVTLELSGSGFELNASTFNGQVDVAPDLRLQVTSRDRGRVRGVSGDGGAVVVATTFTGGVTIRR